MGAGSSRVDASQAPPRRRKRLAFAGCFGVGGPSASAVAAAGGVDGGGNLVASASSSGANEVESQMRERVVMSEDLRASVAAKGLQSSGERDPKVASAHPSSSTISHHLRHSHFGCHENREDALGIENAETNALERSTIKDVMPSGNFHDEVARAERTISQRIASIEPDLVDPLLENADTNTICITEVGGSISEPHLEARDTALDGISSTTTIAFSSERSDISQSSSLSEFPASSVSSPLNGELMPDAFPSGADVPIFRGSQGQSNGSISNDDMVSIFSNGASGQSRATSSSEARRNNRRVMWDVFYRRGSRGHVDSDADDMGFYNRWLDLGDDLFGDEVEETRYFHRRRHGSIRLSQYSRSRIREHRRAVFDSGNEQISAACPLGIHSIGRCTCDSFLVAEGSSARASISRIVMLTEALFEVLDEIHRQPASLSLSVVSIQAPESVVNSLPCKSYKRLDTAQCSDDIEQCHICLTEYEDGDQIRTLPCKHEFHLQCVDKWLKEVHRVCPLCRGDVCEGVS